MRREGLKPKLRPEERKAPEGIRREGLKPDLRPEDRKAPEPAWLGGPKPRLRPEDRKIPEPAWGEEPKREIFPEGREGLTMPEKSPAGETQCVQRVPETIEDRGTKVLRKGELLK